MPSNKELVQEFYQYFKQNQYIPEKGSKPSLQEEFITKDRLDLKVGLIAEEFFELVEAVYNKQAADSLIAAWKNIFESGADEPRSLNVVEAADATADLRYVIEGFDLEAGIPSEAIFEEVHASNMSKLGEDMEPVISDGVTPDFKGKLKPAGKIIAGPNFFEADFEAIIDGREPSRIPAREVLKNKQK